MRTTLLLALQYFGLVFLAGFALGTIRALVLVPRLGERNAELLETPFVVCVAFLAARFVVGRMEERTAGRTWTVGVLALGLMLAAELGVVLWVRGQSVREYAAGRDRVSFAVYLLALALFAAAPRLVRRGRPDPPGPTGRGRG